MKRIVAFCVFMLFFGSIAHANRYVRVQYINIGQLSNKEKWVFVIPFVNKNQKPICIQKVLTTCGCISANYPQDGLKSNQSKNIYLTAKFNKNKKGKFVKSIIVNLSNSKTIVIKVKGIIN